ncbi:hypothetical protein [Pelomonas sp. Root1444]|uniref:hypothetical protein n=1 Tax=Pelomonas sp. Root1444 TaxID=1736464 RepID=UPI00070273AF|nr:hypothetical protein [Pelomonas sp. Root1444]KQY86799.1 hypothetical protein ASD35_18625 [Pelomonas sp. Root1444]
MAEPEAALPPIEIPWKLASTTQPLVTGEPAQTAMSLFFFEPDDANLTGAFPDERLVFVKITASVSPASFPAELSKVAASFLGEGIPCMHLLLDLKVRPNVDGTPPADTIRPYFHAAAPLNRRMLQTGVIGADAYEGESDGVAIGKSGSQMAESLRSHSSTTTASASAGLSLGPFSLGGSVRNTTTDVGSDRAVSQVVDTTSRQASDERRELLSHTTRVENIISLLSTKYVGTPHLSFSLSPQPLQQLSIDPSDPNLWFQQLLARRSSGIEGIQEFTAVIVVPKGTDFCINARLRRVCLLDSLPGPLNYDERFNGTLLQFARMVNYLNRTFPAGTPLEELDIDIIGGLTSGTFKRPVVQLWGLRLGESLVVASVVSPGASAGASQRGSANYKHMLEVWLDTLRDEYERELARSPLERGVLFGENRFLGTCFASGPEADGAFVVSGSNASVSPLFRVPLNQGLFDIGGVRSASASLTTSTRTRALETITRWNTIEKQVSSLLGNPGSGLKETPLVANDPKVVGIFVDAIRKLPADDARNVGLSEAAKLLQLDGAQVKMLQAAGASKLADIATVLQNAPEVERQNTEVARLRALFKSQKIEGTPPELIKLGVTGQDSAAMLATIGKGLTGSSSGAVGGKR